MLDDGKIAPLSLEMFCVTFMKYLLVCKRINFDILKKQKQN